MHSTFRSFTRALMVAGLMAWSAAGLAAVDVNTASAADLDSVKGVGPGTSNKILDARKRGPFKDWNDLIERVSGIGPGSAAKLSSNGLTVNGASFAGAAPPKAASSDKSAKDTVAKKP